MSHFGAYYDLPGAPQEYYATAGMGRVDPGIDISHYGAPYQGMFGLGAYVDVAVPPGLGAYVETGRAPELFYATAGMGQWTPGPGQTPADDPRMVKKFARVRGDYRPRNIPSDLAARAAGLILNEARKQFSGMTVRKIGTTGWNRQGRVGFEVILRQPMRAGEIKRKIAIIGRLVGPRVGTNTQLIAALTHINANDYFAGAPVDEGALPSPTVTPKEEEGFLAKKVGGIPVWLIGGLGIVAVGGVAFAATRKKPAAVAANRRRRRRRR